MADDVTHSRGVRYKLDKWLPTIYFVIGQGVWFALVISAARGYSWVGIVCAAAAIGAHLAWVPRPAEELKLIACVALIGGLWDSAMAHFAILSYPQGMLVPGMAPMWIPALWALFAAQFNTTYKWLKNRLWVAAVLGAIAGPLSFRAGTALHAVQFTDLIASPMILAVGWALLLPIIALLSRIWDGARPAPHAQVLRGVE